MNPEYLQLLPGNIILVGFDRAFRQSVKEAYYEGVTPKEIAQYCGMLESVIRMTLLRELGLKRGQKLRRPPSKAT